MECGGCEQGGRWKWKAGRGVKNGMGMWDGNFEYGSCKRLGYGMRGSKRGGKWNGEK